MCIHPRVYLMPTSARVKVQFMGAGESALIGQDWGLL